MLKESKKGERGQVLLIVILVIIVSLTIGLSIASRSITNIRTSTEEAESQKALAAAEAGIEKTLQDLTVSSGTFLPNDSSYETDIDPVEDVNSFLVDGGSLIAQGEGVDIWLAEHINDEEIDYTKTLKLKKSHFFLYWGVGNETDCNSADPSEWPAAIEAIVVWMTDITDPTTIRTTRYAFDACDGNGGRDNRGNNFISAVLDSLTIGGKTLKLRTATGDDSIHADNVIFIRVIPIYKSTIIGVQACAPGGGSCTDLPIQGYQITSTGTAGETSRKISVFKGFSSAFLPYISYGLFVPDRD